MTAHRVACAIAVLVGSPYMAAAQIGWPGAAPAAAVESKPKAEATPKPVAAKAVAEPEGSKTVAAAPKARVVETRKAVPVAAKAATAPAVAPMSPNYLQSLTELLARQTAAIEALLRRLESNERRTISPSALDASPVDPTYAAPTPIVVAPSAIAVQVPSSTLVSEPAAASASAAPTAPIARPAIPSSSAFARWGEVQSANLSFRYRDVENSSGVQTISQGQNRTEFKGRFKFDRQGRYALNAGVFSGGSFGGSWNNTGMGTGDAAHDLYVKQFFFAAAPISGLALQYGGIYVSRGEGTEITTYDNDAYLTGQRVTLKRPRHFWFDEISATQAYLGDVTTPGIWDRYQRLAEPNYYQFLLAKRVGTRLGLSGDYTQVDGVPTWRGAFGLKAPEMAALDAVRVETYARSVTGPTVFGWALTADKKVGRTSMSGGFASVDEEYGGLNSDFHLQGNRWFGKATATLFPVLSVTGLYTWALDTDYAIVNKERFDVVFTYDVLKTFVPARR